MKIRCFGCFALYVARVLRVDLLFTLLSVSCFMA